jgi:hypothetical protein
MGGSAEKLCTNPTAPVNTGRVTPFRRHDCKDLDAGSSGRHDDQTLTMESVMAQHCRISVLIAHNDPIIAAGLVTLLQQERDFEVSVYNSALTSSAPTPPALVVVADYDSGLRLLESAGAGSPRVINASDCDTFPCEIRRLASDLITSRAARRACDPVVRGRCADRRKQSIAVPTGERACLSGSPGFRAQRPAP